MRFRKSCLQAIRFSIYKIKFQNLRAFNPIMNNYKKIKDKKIIFFYGDDDWSQISHAEIVNFLVI